jgi:transcriptional regulator with XRE-family HTH domain
MITPGIKLRELRKERKVSLLNLALDISSTAKTLSRIENDTTEQPSRELIQSIFDALDTYLPVKFKDRHFVFSAYKYKLSFPLPSPSETEEAIKHWRDTYSIVPFPAYLVDFSQRLLEWNRLAPRLLGINYDNPQTSLFENVTIFDVTFGLASKFVEIVNREEYIPELIRTMKSEFIPYVGEPWYEPRISEAKQKYPEFAKIWNSLPDGENLIAPELGNTIPISIKPSEKEGLLRFRLLRVDFATDPRFRVVQWIPIDEITHLQCMIWIKESTVYSQ